MKKHLLTLALLAAALPTFAQDAATSSSGSNATATLTPTITGSNAQTESNSLGMANASPNQQITFNTDTPAQTSSTLTEHVHYSGSQTLKNVPAIAMSGPASGPCTGISGGLAVAGAGFGVGVNGSTVMDDCRLRENTRVLGMAMQSVDGNANPAQRAELMSLFMDAARGLAAYNRQILQNAVKEEPK